MTAARLYGWTVEGELGSTLDRLLAGSVQLWHLTPALRGWYFAGWNAGRASREEEVVRARDDAAFWFERAHNPGRRFESMIQRRLDVAAVERASAPTDEAFYGAVLVAATTPRRAA